MPKIKLIIFDVDGTLAEQFSLELLPGVRLFFDLLFRNDCPDTPRAAIATNQGGVGMRYWMEKAGFGRPHEFPTDEEINERMKELVAKIGHGRIIPVYASYRFRTKQGKWAPVPPEEMGNPSWEQEWRKPLPGMLIQAMQDAGSAPDETLFVGDREDDRSAARAAGCTFEWARDFFARPWNSCEQLEQLLEG